MQSGERGRSAGVCPEAGRVTRRAGQPQSLPAENQGAGQRQDSRTGRQSEVSGAAKKTGHAAGVAVYGEVAPSVRARLVAADWCVCPRARYLGRDCLSRPDRRHDLHGQGKQGEWQAPRPAGVGVGVTGTRTGPPMARDLQPRLLALEADGLTHLGKRHAGCCRPTADPQPLSTPSSPELRCRARRRAGRRHAKGSEAHR
jgi:hypothetical protein